MRRLLIQRTSTSTAAAAAPASAAPIVASATTSGATCTGAAAAAAPQHTAPPSIPVCQLGQSCHRGNTTSAVAAPGSGGGGAVCAGGCSAASVRHFSTTAIASASAAEKKKKQQQSASKKASASSSSSSSRFQKRSSETPSKGEKVIAGKDGDDFGESTNVNQQRSKKKRQKDLNINDRLAHVASSAGYRLSTLFTSGGTTGSTRTNVVDSCEDLTSIPSAAANGGIEQQLPAAKKNNNKKKGSGKDVLNKLFKPNYPLKRLDSGGSDAFAHPYNTLFHVQLAAANIVTGPAYATLVKKIHSQQQPDSPADGSKSGAKLFNEAQLTSQEEVVLQRSVTLLRSLVKLWFHQIKSSKDAAPTSVAGECDQEEDNADSVDVGDYVKEALEDPTIDWSEAAAIPLVFQRPEKGKSGAAEGEDGAQRPFFYSVKNHPQQYRAGIHVPRTERVKRGDSQEFQQNMFDNVCRALALTTLLHRTVTRACNRAVKSTHGSGKEFSQQDGQVEEDEAKTHDDAAGESATAPMSTIEFDSVVLRLSQSLTERVSLGQFFKGTPPSTHTHGASGAAASATHTSTDAEEGSLISEESGSSSPHHVWMADDELLASTVVVRRLTASCVWHVTRNLCNARDQLLSLATIEALPVVPRRVMAEFLYVYWRPIEQKYRVIQNATLPLSCLPSSPSQASTASSDSPMMMPHAVALNVLLILFLRGYGNGWTHMRGCASESMKKTKKKDLLYPYPSSHCVLQALFSTIRRKDRGGKNGDADEVSVCPNEGPYLLLCCVDRILARALQKINTQVEATKDLPAQTASLIVVREFDSIVRAYHWVMKHCMRVMPASSYTSPLASPPQQDEAGERTSASSKTATKTEAEEDKGSEAEVALSAAEVDLLLQLAERATQLLNTVSTRCGEGRRAYKLQQQQQQQLQSSSSKAKAQPAAAAGPVGALHTPLLLENPVALAVDVVDMLIPLLRRQQMHLSSGDENQQQKLNVVRCMDQQLTESVTTFVHSMVFFVKSEQLIAKFATLYSAALRRGIFGGKSPSLMTLADHRHNLGGDLAFFHSNISRHALRVHKYNQHKERDTNKRQQEGNFVYMRNTLADVDRDHPLLLTHQIRLLLWPTSYSSVATSTTANTTTGGTSSTASEPDSKVEKKKQEEDSAANADTNTAAEQQQEQTNRPTVTESADDATSARDGNAASVPSQVAAFQEALRQSEEALSRVGWTLPAILALLHTHYGEVAHSPVVPSADGSASAVETTASAASSMPSVDRVSSDGDGAAANSNGGDEEDVDKEKGTTATDLAADEQSVPSPDCAAGVEFLGDVVWALYTVTGPDPKALERFAAQPHALQNQQGYVVAPREQIQFLRNAVTRNASTLSLKALCAALALELITPKKLSCFGNTNAEEFAAAVDRLSSPESDDSSDSGIWFTDANVAAPAKRAAGLYLCSEEGGNGSEEGAGVRLRRRHFGSTAPSAVAMLLLKTSFALQRLQRSSGAAASSLDASASSSASSAGGGEGSSAVGTQPPSLEQQWADTQSHVTAAPPPDRNSSGSPAIPAAPPAPPPQAEDVGSGNDDGKSAPPAVVSLAEKQRDADLDFACRAGRRRIRDAINTALAAQLIAVFGGPSPSSSGEVDANVDGAFEGDETTQQQQPAITPNTSNVFNFSGATMFLATHLLTSWVLNSGTSFTTGGHQQLLLPSLMLRRAAFVATSRCAEAAVASVRSSGDRILLWVAFVGDKLQVPLVVPDMSLVLSVCPATGRLQLTRRGAAGNTTEQQNLPPPLDPMRNPPQHVQIVERMIGYTAHNTIKGLQFIPLLRRIFTIQRALGRIGVDVDADDVFESFGRKLNVTCFSVTEQLDLMFMCSHNHLLANVVGLQSARVLATASAYTHAQLASLLSAFARAPVRSSQVVVCDLAQRMLIGCEHRPVEYLVDTFAAVAKLECFESVVFEKVCAALVARSNDIFAFSVSGSSPSDGASSGPSNGLFQGADFAPPPHALSVDAHPLVRMYSVLASVSARGRVVLSRRLREPLMTWMSALKDSESTASSSSSSMLEHKCLAELLPHLAIVYLGDRQLWEVVEAKVRARLHTNMRTQWREDTPTLSTVEDSDGGRVGSYDEGEGVAAAAASLNHELLLALQTAGFPQKGFVVRSTSSSTVQPGSQAEENGDASNDAEETEAAAQEQ